MFILLWDQRKSKIRSINDAKIYKYGKKNNYLVISIRILDSVENIYDIQDANKPHASQIKT